MKKFIVIGVLAVLVLLIIGSIFLCGGNGSKEENTALNSKLISKVSYGCNEKKTIQAEYYQGSTPQSPQPGQPPVPTGSVSLLLSDGRSLALPQTISGSGIRYANSDESVVFWSKGNGAFILENNNQTYSNCVALTPDTGGLTESYIDKEGDFSVRYPAGFVVDENYRYQEFGPVKDISGIKFGIPADLAIGTNLSKNDTGISVEKISDTQECRAGLFVDSAANPAVSVTDNDVLYSVATSSGAGAGNFYEEKV